jgi:hypothetical protein
MNITQQVAASIGTALFSVLLTNGFKASPEVGALQGAVAGGQDPSTLGPEVLGTAIADMADAFGDSFLVATVLVALCLVPAAMLPRKRPPSAVDPSHEPVIHLPH